MKTFVNNNENEFLLRTDSKIKYLKEIINNIPEEIVNVHIYSDDESIDKKKFEMSPLYSFTTCFTKTEDGSLASSVVIPVKKLKLLMDVINDNAKNIVFVESRFQLWLLLLEMISRRTIAIDYRIIGDSLVLAIYFRNKKYYLIVRELSYGIDKLEIDLKRFTNKKMIVLQEIQKIFITKIN